MILLQYLFIPFAIAMLYVAFLTVLALAFTPWITREIMRSEIDFSKMIGEEYMGVVTWTPPKTWC
jgi:hypothetical protein